MPRDLLLPGNRLAVVTALATSYCSTFETVLSSLRKRAALDGISLSIRRYFLIIRERVEDIGVCRLGTQLGRWGKLLNDLARSVAL